MNKSLVLKISLLGIILILASCNSEHKEHPIAKNGVIDLSDWNFEQDGNLNLSGEWEFYWDRFYSYQDFHSNKKTPDIFLNVPAVWNGAKIDDITISADGFATYRLTIITNSEQKKLAIRTLNQSTAYKLFFNDELVAENGTIGKSADESIPLAYPHEVFLELDTTVNEIILQISNYHDRFGGAWNPIIIGTHFHITKNKTFHYGLDTLLLGVLLLMFVYHIGLYFYRHNDIASLLFAVFNFIILLRILTTSEHIILEIFPNISRVIYLKIEYITFFLPFPIFMFFNEYLFPKTTIKRLNQIFLIIALLFSIFTLVVPSKISSYSIPIYQIVSMFAMIYMLYIVIKATAKKHKGAVFILIGYIITMLAVVNDILHAQRIIYTLFLVQFGFFIFTLLHAFVLALKIYDVERQKREFETSFKTVSTLNEIGKAITSQLSVAKIRDSIQHNIKKVMNAEYVKLEFKNELDKSSNNKELDENNIKLQNQLDYKSEISKPIEINDKEIGNLIVQTSTEDAYFEYHESIIENIVAYAAIAIENTNFIQEISNQKDEIIKAYSKLRLSEERLQKILDNLSEGMAAADLNGYIIYANPAICKMLGYTKEEMVGQHFHKFRIEDDLDNGSNTFQNILNKEIEILKTEIRCIRKDNSTFWTKYSVTPIYDKNNNIVELVGILTDIDKLKQNEITIKKAHNSIRDSISYASKIQTAILPEIKTLKQHFLDAFVLLHPKDIVSGDFYWYKRINNKLIIVAADCTGHGVPGAFMSILGIAFLNEIVNENTVSSTAMILETLRCSIKHALHQTGRADEQKDGMDISLCIFDKEEKTVQFSGANQPIFILRDSDKAFNCNKENEVKVQENSKRNLYHIKADKQPISIYFNEKPFNECKISLEDGDTLYLFSDGFIDQPGGKDFRKFMMKNFKNLILNIQESSLSQQSLILEKQFLEWRNGYKQIDDILVLGVEI